MPSLSVVIPAYNEALRLPATLRSIGRHLAGEPLDSAEVIVVDDGSSDDTGRRALDETAEIERGRATLRVLTNERNRGKGFSVRRGMLAARKDWVLFTDADLSAPITELEGLLSAAKDGHAVAIGSRAINRALIGVRQPVYREVVGRAFNLSVRLLTGLDIADTQCGFKLFSLSAAREIAARQRLERFGFDVEQLYLARKLGLTVAEVPVRWNDAEGSSVGLAEGLGAFADVWRVRWNDWRGRYS